MKKVSKIEKIIKKNAQKAKVALLKANKKKANLCLKAYLRALKKGRGLVEQQFYCNDAYAVFVILKHKTFKGEVVLVDNNNIIITNKEYV